MTFIFDYLNGYTEGEVTISYRFITVPEEKRDPIIDGYFKNYRKYFRTELLEDLSEKNSKVLAGLIDGDLWCRKPSLESAKIYKDAGADVYMYYLDIEMPIDFMLKSPSPYGTGHTNDIPLMLGKLISTQFIFNYDFEKRKLSHIKKKTIINDLKKKCHPRNLRKSFRFKKFCLKIS